MLVKVLHHVRHVHERAKSRVRALSLQEKAMLSLSQTLFALAIAVGLITIFGSYLGYGIGTLSIYVLASLVLLLLSYVIYRRLTKIAFVEYVITMFIVGILDEEAPVGFYGSLLFLGGLFVAASPLVYTYMMAHPTLVQSPTLYVIGLLLIGAVLSAIAVVWYVRKIFTE